LIRCVNATTGQEIWTLSGWGDGGGFVAQNGAIAAGEYVYLNMYDMQINAIGKGHSATTLEAPIADIAQGSGLVLKGTVMDISAGTKQNQQAANFPYGVPAVSDSSQGDWMPYVYMQKPKPSNTTGVSVTIDVVDANGNFRNIGKTTTDSTGAYSLQWTPDISGKYTVMATFAGSESYWPSYAESSFAVSNPTPTASPIQQISLPPTETYFAISTAAIIIAIAIVGLLIILVIRKRP